MSFISLWAGDLDCASNLPVHLGRLYDSIPSTRWQREPGVCEERELVPVEELLEPFALHEQFIAQAAAVAKRDRLRLAAVVVAVYTTEPPETAVLQPEGCGLRFLGTFPENL